MVLADTSIWIRALAGRTSYAGEMDRLLSLDQIVGHDLVYGELLIGDRGGRKKFLSSYNQMHQSATLPHREVVLFVQKRGLHGRGIGWIDVHLLAAAMVARCKLWTADASLFNVAQELGVAHRALE